MRVGAHGDERCQRNEVAAAWRWLARLCNQRPQRVTATILLAFLKPSAPALSLAYPRQFIKLLRLILQGVVPKIHALVDADDLPEEKAALVTALLLRPAV